MIFYSVPGAGIFGGIKTAAQFVELLCQEGVSACLVTPDGNAPQWFSCKVPVISAERMRSDWSPADALIFSFPGDYEAFQAVPPRVFFHCQGTDPAIDPVLQDPSVTLLTAWPQARRYVFEKAGRDTFDTGIAVSEAFYYRGRPKFAGMAACMPRRGRALIDACEAACPHLDFYRIENRIEREAADMMQAAEFYLATSENEWFGLPALEAMAAGAVVVSVPVIGGTDYLCPDRNCVVAAAEELPAALRRISGKDQAATRARLREYALVTAAGYRLRIQQHRLRELLKGPFREYCNG